MSEDNLKLKFQIGSLAFEAEGQAGVVKKEREDILSFLAQYLNEKTLCLPKQSLEPGRQIEAVDGIVNESTNKSKIKYDSFVAMKKDKGFKSDADVIMGACCFLYFCDGVEYFNTCDVKNLLQKSHMKLPSNISQCMIQNIKKALVIECEAEGEKKNIQKVYTVSDVSEEWLLNYNVVKK